MAAEKVRYVSYTPRDFAVHVLARQLSEKAGVTITAFQSKGSTNKDKESALAERLKQMSANGVSSLLKWSEDYVVENVPTGIGKSLVFSEVEGFVKEVKDLRRNNATKVKTDGWEN